MDPIPLHIVDEEGRLLAILRAPADGRSDPYYEVVQSDSKRPRDEREDLAHGCNIQDP